MRGLLEERLFDGVPVKLSRRLTSRAPCSCVGLFISTSSHWVEEDRSLNFGTGFRVEGHGFELLGLIGV